MAKVVVTKSKLDSLAQHINTKAGTTGAKTIAQMQATVDGISTKMAVTWHQCPEAVRNYLANVTYDPSDYSNSQIANYAPATPVEANTKPIGKTVGGVTYYNEVPNVETPFSADSAAGTLKPLDALRWINTPHAPNVRDLGGWACDGGKVKYGMMFRGGDMDATDRNVLVDQCGVRAELNLRGKNEADSTPPTSSILGTDILYYIPDIYQWYSIANKTVWRGMLRFAFDCVLHNQPVYFHCAAGADRTGTFACVIEALLGVSQSDIDKDYELTCFATGTGSDGTARRRNESEWTGLINQINALPGSTFRDKVVGWVATLGFTAAEINAFRAAMIDGTPETVTPSIDTYTVTNTLTNATSDNAATSATEYQPYTAKITPASGYAISSVKVKMGGVDVTGSVWSGIQTVLRRKVTTTLTHCTSDNSRTSVIDGQGYAATLAAELGYTLEGATISITMGGVDVSTFYKDGVIAIPNVTGDLVITVTAVKQAQENMFPAHFFDTDGTTVFGNGKGYENGYRFGSDGGVRDGATGRSITGYLDVSGYTKMVVSGSTVGSMQGGYPVVWYDSSRAVLSKGGAYETTSIPDGTWDIPSGANYVRLSCGLDPVDMVVNLA
jgi:protein tyrosine/serine phosphatase